MQFASTASAVVEHRMNAHATNASSEMSLTTAGPMRRYGLPMWLDEKLPQDVVHHAIQMRDLD
jgi:hypothetical protein